jgi:hypothetical protein
VDLASWEGLREGTAFPRRNPAALLPALSPRRRVYFEAGYVPPSLVENFAQAIRAIGET